MSNAIAFSIKDAASAAGIGRTTLYELIKQGELKPSKIGTRTLILRTDLEALIERNRISGAA